MEYLGGMKLEFSDLWTFCLPVQECYRIWLKDLFLCHGHLDSTETEVIKFESKKVLSVMITVITASLAKRRLCFW